MSFLTPTENHQSKIINIPIPAIIYILLFSFILFGCQKDLPLSIPKSYDVIAYAATYGKGIYITENGGKSWLPFNSDQEDLHAYYKRLYLNPENTNVLYVTTTGAGLFLLNIKIGTLVKIYQFRDENITSIAFKNNPSEPPQNNNMLVSLNTGGILKTTNYLNTWEPLNQKLTYRDVNVLYNYGKDLFSGTVKELFRWDETISQWKSSSEGIKNKNIISMDGWLKGKVLYAGSGPPESKKGRFEHIPSIYKSTDQGKSWTASDTGIPDETLVYVISINPKRPERIYLGTSDGLYRSTNSGVNWIKMKHGLPKDLRIFDIKMAQMPDGTDVVYAAGSRGVFMTTDDNDTLWQNKSYGLEPTAITSIILIPD